MEDPPAPLAVEDGSALALEDLPAVPVPPPRRKRQCLARKAEQSTVVEQHEEVALFTPSSVCDGVRCMARTWGNGKGGQCSQKRVPGSDLCKVLGNQEQCGNKKQLLFFSLNLLRPLEIGSQFAVVSVPAPKVHARGEGPAHGRVDGPIPERKLKEFRAFRILHTPAAEG